MLQKKRGGECLSDEYINTHSYLKWKCSRNHEWKATMASVKNTNRWCPKCWKEDVQPTVEQLDKIAKSRGGKLLSTVYKNNTTKMEWICKRGHMVLRFDLC